MACDVCRVKKVRCNNQLPCEYCKSHNAECTYPPTSRKRKNPEPPGATTVYLQQQQARALRMESPVQQFVPQSSGYIPSQLPSHHYDHPLPTPPAQHRTSYSRTASSPVSTGGYPSYYEPNTPRRPSHSQYGHQDNGHVGGGGGGGGAIPIDPALFAIDPALSAPPPPAVDPSLGGDPSLGVDPSLSIDPNLGIDPSLSAAPPMVEEKGEGPNGDKLNRTELGSVASDRVAEVGKIEGKDAPSHATFEETKEEAKLEGRGSDIIPQDEKPEPVFEKKEEVGFSTST